MASPAAGLIQANRHEQHNICGEKLSLSVQGPLDQGCETQVWTGLDLQDRCPERAELPRGREQAAHPQVSTQSHSPSPLHRVEIHLYLLVLTKHIIHRSSPCSQNRSGTKPKYSCLPRGTAWSVAWADSWTENLKIVSQDQSVSCRGAIRAGTTLGAQSMPAGWAFFHSRNFLLGPHRGPGTMLCTGHTPTRGLQVCPHRTEEGN